MLTKEEIMSIGLSAFAKIASAVYGGVKGAQATEAAGRYLGKLLNNTRAEGRRVGSMDPSQSLYAQYHINDNWRRIKDRNEQAAGTAAVMGLSPAQVAAVAKENAAGGADVAARVAASEAALQEQRVEQNRNRQQRLEELEYANLNDKRQQIGNAVQNGLNTAGGMSQA